VPNVVNGAGSVTYVIDAVARPLVDGGGAGHG
jgi:hypothetical protein